MPSVIRQVITHTNGSRIATASAPFQWRYDISPGNLDVTTRAQTYARYYLQSQPLHLQTRRAVRSIDKEKFRWRIACPATLSSKRTVRTWLSRRVGTAVREELKRRGFGEDGEILRLLGESEDHFERSRRPPTQLKGALVVNLRESVFTAPFTAVQELCRMMFNDILTRKRRRY